MTQSRKVCAIEALKNLKSLYEINEENKKRRKHKFWINPFLELRGLHDLEARLLKDILWEMRCDISPSVRLAVTLRYLATGDSFRSIEFLTHISCKTISAFVPEVLNALIIDALQKQFLKTPMTKSEWLSVVNEFNGIWQFSYTLGAIDGKHIRIKAPAPSGSDFLNYKGFFSIILLAVVDAHSRFIYVDIGANGTASDVVAYKNSSLYEKLSKGQINIPTSKPLKGQISPTPFFFIDDDIFAFALNRHMVKAFDRNLDLNTAQGAQFNSIVG